MHPDYLKQVMESLSEEDAHELLVEIYEAEGWVVKNIHEADRVNERGVDIVAERGDERHLIAVKRHPRGPDLDQLRRFHSRKGEGSLHYFFLASPTEPFRMKMEKYGRDVRFVGPANFHRELVTRESVKYLRYLFSEHPAAHELAMAATLMWGHRDVVVASPLPTRGDLAAVWRLKDGILKTRSAIGVLAVLWEDRLMSSRDLDSTRNVATLDNLISDLDYVQRFCGGCLAAAFVDVSRTRPHVLAQLWASVRMRTNWTDFCGRAEHLSREKEVFDFARTCWAVPGPRAVGGVSPKGGWGWMKGFHSGLAGAVSKLSEAAKDLDVAVDLAWEDVTSGTDDSIFPDLRPRR